MKRLVIVALLAACGGDKQAPRTTNPAAPAQPQDAHDEDRSERCRAFADRVVECNRGGAILNDSEATRVRDIAFAVCTKTTDDAAALHYYGDVDRKIECMQGKDCGDVRVCLTRDDPSQ